MIGSGSAACTNEAIIWLSTEPTGARSILWLNCAIRTTSPRGIANGWFSADQLAGQRPGIQQTTVTASVYPASKRHSGPCYGRGSGKRIDKAIIWTAVRPLLHDQANQGQERGLGLALV